MSEIAVSAPPPPPPPPPPPAQPVRPESYDFGKPFSFVFDDPRWLQKILIGGLFYIAAFLLVGVFFILGYVAQTARNIIAGHEYPLPEWQDLGKFFSEGLRLFGVMICWTAPLILCAVFFMVPAIMADVADSDFAQELSGGIAGCMMCLFVPLMLVMMFFMPAALLFAIAEERFGAAFEIGRIWAFIRDNIGNYLLAILIYIIASQFISGLGIFLLCVGLVFTGFWSSLITMHGFAQVYRLARRPV